MFTVQESQTTNGATTFLAPVYKETRNEALSAYHSILSYAAVSSVDIHAVAIFDERLNVVACEYFDHTIVTTDG